MVIVRATPMPILQMYSGKTKEKFKCTGHIQTKMYNRLIKIVEKKQREKIQIWQQDIYWTFTQMITYRQNYKSNSGTLWGKRFGIMLEMLLQ